MKKDYLYYGNCLDILPNIVDKSIDLILCDLPYGTTQNKWDCPINLDLLWNQYKRVIKPKGVIILFAQSPFDKVLGASNLEWFRYEYIWKKDNATGFLNANKAPLKIHENILIFYENQGNYNPQMLKGFKPFTVKRGHNGSNYKENVIDRVITTNNGERYPTSILEFERDKDKIHPTQKPVKLCEFLINTYSNIHDTVLDNCLGSGTTAIAAINTHRYFIGIENNLGYYGQASSRIKEAYKKGARATSKNIEGLIYREFSRSRIKVI